MTPQGRVLVYRNEILPWSETFVAAQAAALSRYEPLLVGRYRVDGADLRGVQVRTASAAPPPAERWRRLRKPRFDAAGLDALRSYGAALIHAHFGKDGMAARPLARRLGLPYVVTFHGFDATRSVELGADPRWWIYGRRLPGLVSGSAVTIAVSDHVRRALIARGAPAERIVTHYIGIDTARFDAHREGRTPGLIVAVGRMVEKKGFESLVDALRILRTTNDRARLVIVGDGERRAALEARAAGLGDAVEFTGAQPSEVVARWLQQAAVVAVPSVTDARDETEGLPMVLLEAMATASPVVATRHAGIPEAVEDGTSGLLVGERQPQALAEAIGRLLTDHELAARLGGGARERVLSGFDLHRQAIALETIYDRVAGGSPPATRSSAPSAP